MKLIQQAFSNILNKVSDRRKERPHRVGDAQWGLDVKGLKLSETVGRQDL